MRGSFHRHKYMDISNYESMYKYPEIHEYVKHADTKVNANMHTRFRTVASR